jgi:hypothetical protein
MAKYSKTQKDQIRGMRDAFGGALPRIGKQEGFICHALSAWGEETGRYRDAKNARYLVGSALGDSLTLSRWQRKNGHEETADPFTRAGDELRRAWLRKLIRDCDKAIAS